MKGVEILVYRGAIDMVNLVVAVELKLTCEELHAQNGEDKHEDKHDNREGTNVNERAEHRPQ